MAAVLLAAYSVLVLVIVAWPTPVDQKAHGYIIRLLREAHDHHVLMFVGYAQVEFSANVAMFVPLGLLLGVLLGPRRWGYAILIGFALSSTIELLQFALLPGRYGTVDDVIANTSGAVIGALLARSFLRREAARATRTASGPR
ncbi:VanZ family protein [Herbiconiux liangxiaofengii]|uniref:VanZ family protein n=1 Tax=Herbiconiux liangxiaofengii TaxID=3342795 RepID=UPI0035B943DD